MIAIIPARKGSKGLLGKNTALLRAIPLIEWTLQAAITSGIFEKIVVSSDCSDVQRITEKLSVSFIQRSAVLSQDTTPMRDVVIDVLSGDAGSEYDAFALLQPTSPLRTAFHIQECHKLFTHTGERSCLSVNSVENTLLKSFIAREGRLFPLEAGRYSEQRRQDLPDVVKPNGAIYMQNSALFIHGETFIPQGSSYYLMGRRQSVDIDTEQDLLLAERYLCEMDYESAHSGKDHGKAPV